MLESFWRHTLGFLSCFPSSLLNEAVPGLYASPGGHSHLSEGSASHSERGKSARALKEPERTCGPPSSTSKTHYEKALVNRTRATLCFRCQSVQCTPGTSYQLFTGLWSPSTSHCLMLVRDPISRFISDLPLTVTCYRSQ